MTQFSMIAPALIVTLSPIVVGSVDDRPWIDHAVPPDLHQPGAFQHLLALVHGMSQDIQLEKPIVFQVIFGTTPHMNSPNTT